MLQQQLDNQSWRLESQALAKLRQKLTKGHPTLKESYGSPYRGVLTGFNEAFVIDRATRDRLIAEDSRSAEILKPFLEGKDLKKWHSEPRDLWLIFTRRGIDIEQYPAVLNHLTQYKERLTPKPKEWPKGEKWGGRKSGPYQWYEIQDTVAYYEQFEQPKIIWADIANSNQFSFTQNYFFLTNTGYILPTTDLFLLGWLNSSAFQFIFSSISPKIRGGFFRYIRQYIETLPIPKATASQKQSLGQLAERCQQLAEARYAIEQSVRQRIPDLRPEDRDAKLSKKPLNWWQLDFAAFRKEIKRLYKEDIPLTERNEWESWLTAEADKITQLSQQLAESEKQLNQQVYALFKLTPTEIALIEAALLD